MANNHEDNLDIDDVKIDDEALKETPETELRAEIMTKFGLTEEEHADLITKVLNDKLEDRKKLGTAIKQKRTWRDKFNTVKPAEKKEDKKEDAKTFSQIDIDALVDKKLNERLDSREVDSAEMSDELKAQVKSYAALNKVSIKDALKSEYIQFQLNKELDAKELDDASISNKHDKSKSNKNFKDMSPSDFDVSTEQGRKDWADYKKHLQSAK